MCEGVEEELRGEDAREGDVEAVEQAPHLGEGAVFGEQPAVELRLRGVDDKVLRGLGVGLEASGGLWAGGEWGVMGGYGEGVICVRG